MKPLQEQFTKTFVPEKSEEDKIKAIDQNIENLIKMLRQELFKRCAIANVNHLPGVAVDLEMLDTDIKEFIKSL